ncbi:GNAT family N-acetyltransferase [Antrihabitans stalactiti]|uniref:GNAT family N-acetyltransferase n=1 Tax=Antrihabitans stalactiti TaxID=2584121 RepID=A0A848KEG8_9NOCA|nr:GNAT family N-acetyltransferase [Antrihabitans stalactiti]NMN96028.1 GNAT family N-acetyltransferase [Antrihabitans stalactiti]
MIRRATPDDVDAMVGLVYELAEYEKLRHECTLTSDQLRTALFGPQPALYAHVVEVEGEIVGIAIWFLNYSTWDGVHGIYLEDLYVTPQRRGAGYGRALLAELARECTRKGYSRLAWSVLDWNAPSIAFYESLGAIAQDEWTTFRLSGGALANLAARED